MKSIHRLPPKFRQAWRILIITIDDPTTREEAVSRANAIVIVATHDNEPKVLAEVSAQVIGTMKGRAAAAIDEKEFLQQT